MRIRIFSGTVSWDPRISSESAGIIIGNVDRQVNDAFDEWKGDNPSCDVMDVQMSTQLYALGNSVIVYAVTLAIEYMVSPAKDVEEEEA